MIIKINNNNPLRLIFSSKKLFISLNNSLFNSYNPFILNIYKAIKNDFIYIFH